MKLVCALLSTFIFVFGVFAQTPTDLSDLNLGFEKVSPNQPLPDKWLQFGSGYNLKIDNSEKKSGTNSVSIEGLATKTDKTFGTVALSIPANFDGKEIELRGFLKLKDVTDGYTGLWLRIDGASGTLQFDNMQSRGLKGSTDWTSYSIKLPLSPEAVRVTFGALLSGNGQIWVDDLQILIDGKDIAEAKPRAPIEYKAKKDKEFDNGSNITVGKLSDAKINDLAVLGKVWGFLKYHHPAIAKGDYNWDYELFRVLPKVLEAKNRQQRNDVLSVWVESLGAFEITNNAEKKSADTIKISPDFAWIDEKTFGEKLAAQLNRVKNAKRENRNYYIGLFEGVNNPQFKNEEAYRTMTYPDAGFRLLGLFRYWNVIEYYFPNKHLIGENWNNVLTEFVPKFAAAPSEIEYKKAALALIGRIHDTHANIWGRDETLDKFRGLNSPAIGVTFVEEKAVVTRFWDQALGEKTSLKIGDTIETINNRKVSDLIKERLSLTPASNYPTKLRDIATHLLKTNENSLTIKYKRGSETKEVQIEAYPKDKLKINAGEMYSKPIPPFKLIQPDIAYLYPGSLKQGEIAKIIPDIAATKGLIVDLRSYPSDFIVFSLGEFLMPKPTGFVKFTNGSVTAPGSFTFTGEIKVGRENSDYYKGKVVILIDETTQSQAEYTTMALRNAPRATVVGSTTAGADGNVSQFFLPGGISTMISGIGVYYPDGRETQRVGIIPDVVLKPTIKGIAAGRDELLEKALEIINAK